jgi:dUTP pyrophosphatase
MELKKRCLKLILRKYVMEGSLLDARIVAVKLLKKTGKLPEKAHDSDAGYDLFAPEDVTLKPGELKQVPIGIAIQLPEGYWAALRDKGSRALQGLHVLAGIIDQDYRGEVIAVIQNLGHKAITIKTGEKVCQMILHPVYPALIFEVDELSKTKRGKGGFGSTGL